jgi:hypothetical protein
MSSHKGNRALEEFQEEELIALVRETVSQLHSLGDRLERYAESRLPREGVSNAGTTASGSEELDGRSEQA